MYERGLRPIPQFSVSPYWLDFAIIAGDRKLDIEVDGEMYHRDWNGTLMRRDRLRTQVLLEQGWHVIRFWVYELRDDIEGCVQRIVDWENNN